MKKLQFSLQFILRQLCNIAILILAVVLFGCDPAITLIIRPVQLSNTKIILVVKKEFLVVDSLLVKRSWQSVPNRFSVAKQLADLASLSDSTERMAMFGLGGWNDRYHSLIAGVVDTLAISDRSSTVFLTDSVSVYRYLQSQPTSGLFDHRLHIP